MESYDRPEQSDLGDVSAKYRMAGWENVILGGARNAAA